MSSSTEPPFNSEDADVEKSSPAGDKQDTADDGIRLIPFGREHCIPASLMTLKEYPFVENFLAATSTIDMYGDRYGVACVDSENTLAGYYIGHVIPINGKVGFGRKKVANLAQICVSSSFQKRGLATRMGRYMIEGKHPEFKVEDYDEILVQDTDVFNSPSWLFSDRCGFRYWPTHDIICRLGLSGYLQIVLVAQHVLPGQFLKRYCKSEEEIEIQEQFEKQKGILACVISGLVPCAYWTLYFVLQCGDLGVNGSFVGYLFGVMYLMLACRFLLAHLLTFNSSTPPVFREYDFWWGWGLGLSHVLTIIAGFPLLGWSGGFYLGGSGINYLKKESKRAIAMVYLPISLFTLMMFLAHTLLRVLQPSFLLDNPFVDVLGTASFYFSVTDIAMGPILAFPSGGAVLRRWNIFVYAAILLAWLALLLVTILVPKDTTTFMNLSYAACKA